MKNGSIKRLIALLLCAIAVTLCACDKTPSGKPGETPVLPGDEDGDHYVTDFEITELPNKLTYAVGEYFDITGIDVKITWEDDVVWTLSGGDISAGDLTVRPSGPLTADVDKVEIIFDEYIAEIPIEIEFVTELVITRSPVKITYKAGERFDPSGMLVVGKTASGVTSDITDYDYSPKGELTADDTRITVTYNKATAYVDITVVEESLMFYMEAENAELIKGSPNSNMQNKKSGDPAGFDLCEKSSGGDFVTDAQPGDKVKFTFDSPRAGYGKITLVASSNATVVGNGTKSAPSICLDMQVNKVYKFTVNGHEVSVADSVVMQGVEIDGGSRETWVYWRHVSLGAFVFDEGENTVVLEVISGGDYTHSYGGKAYGQIDALGIVLDAKLGGLDDGNTKTGIEVSKLPNKTVYALGESFDETGMDVTLLWSDGAQWTLSDGYFSRSELVVETDDLTTVGDKKVTVRYGEFTDDFDIVIEGPKNIKVTAQPAKTSYKAGDAFDPTGTQVNFVTESGLEMPVPFDELTFSAGVLEEGQTVTVSYGGLSAELEITVVSADACERGEHELYDVQASAATCTVDGNNAHKRCHNCERYFDVDGNECDRAEAVVAALGHAFDVPRYVDGNTHSVRCMRCDANENHEHTGVGGHYLIVAKNPNKVWYVAGEKLDTDRLEVYLSDVCADGCKNSQKVAAADLTYIYASGESFSAGDTHVDISYEKGGNTYVGTINVRVVASQADLITIDNAAAELVNGTAQGNAIGNRNNDTGGVGQAGYGGSYVSNCKPGDKIIFKFSLDDAATGRIIVQAASNATVSGNASDGHPEYALGIMASDVMTVKVNGVEIDISSQILKGSVSNLQAPSSTNRWVWTNWSSIDLGELSLLAGENTVEIGFVNPKALEDTYGNNACGPVDCVNVII